VEQEETRKQIAKKKQAMLLGSHLVDWQIQASMIQEC
jgi:hypothetical protein